MQRIILAAAVCAAFGAAPAGAQTLEETLGRVLQGFGAQGQQGQQDPRYDPREDPRAERFREDRRRPYDDRMEVQERIRVLDEAEQRLEAQERQIERDRRRINEERRRLTRGG